MPPCYDFSNPDNPEDIRTIFQEINQTHEFFENGTKWDRVWNVPNIGVDTRIDPHSSSDFLKKTAKGGTVGDVWDLAKEMKERRIEKEGRDVIGERAAEAQKKKDNDIKAARRKERAKAVKEKKNK